MARTGDARATRRRARARTQREESALSHHALLGFAQARQYDFFPVTFVLPREYAMFVEEFKRSGG